METNNDTGWGAKPVAEPEYGSPAWIVKRDYLLSVWEASKVTLETAKADEMASRKAFVDFSFNPDKKEGTERIELHNGFEAKAVKKLNYTFKSFDPSIEVADAVEMTLEKLEAVDDQGKFIAQRLVKWTPSLSLTEYRDLAPQYKTIVDAVIETKEGAPTLEIIAPKGSKK